MSQIEDEGSDDVAEEVIGTPLDLSAFQSALCQTPGDGKGHISVYTVGVNFHSGSLKGNAEAFKGVRMVRDAAIGLAAQILVDETELSNFVDAMGGGAKSCSIPVNGPSSEWNIYGKTSHGILNTTDQQASKTDQQGPSAGGQLQQIVDPTTPGENGITFFWSNYKDTDHVFEILEDRIAQLSNGKQYFYGLNDPTILLPSPITNPVSDITYYANPVGPEVNTLFWNVLNKGKMNRLATLAQQLSAAEERQIVNF